MHKDQNECLEDLEDIYSALHRLATPGKYLSTEELEQQLELTAQNKD